MECPKLPILAIFSALLTLCCTVEITMNVNNINLNLRNDTGYGNYTSIRELANQTTSNTTGASEPFRVCGMTQNTDVFRLLQPTKCETFEDSDVFEDGIILLYKENIQPYTFDVRIYYKDVTYITFYSWSKTRQITNYYNGKYRPQSKAEVDLFNKLKCRPEAWKVIAGIKSHAWNNDEWQTKDVDLKLAGSSTGSNKLYRTLDALEGDVPSPGLYDSATTVNCIVIDCKAKSKPPFDFFVTANGHVVNMSPFYNETGDGVNEIMNENKTFYRYQYNDLFTDDTGERTKNMKYIYRGDYGYGWEEKARSDFETVIFWKVEPTGSRVRTNETYHFMAPKLTATFVTGLTPIEEARLRLPQKVICDIQKRINETVDAMEKKKTHHVNVSNYKYFITNGGLLLVWLGTTETTVAEQYNISSTQTRGRRDTGSQVNTHTSQAHATVQFAYDKIKKHINRMQGSLGYAWCLDQNRQQVLLQDMAYTNPKLLVKELFPGQGLSATVVGDVIGLSKCIPVDPDSVSLYTNLRVDGKNPHNKCYERPLVRFQFANNATHATDFIGQLGTDNEILLTTMARRPCHGMNTMYFEMGDYYALYINLTFEKMIPKHDVSVVDGRIGLDLEVLENVDFVALEAYSREEIRSASVANYIDILREQDFLLTTMYDNMEETKFQSNGWLKFMKFMEGVTSTLGALGTAIMSVAGAVAGAITSVIGGLMGFLQNPFGGMLIIAIVVGVAFCAFLAYKYMSKARRQPLDFVFPGSQQKVGINEDTEVNDEMADKGEEMVAAFYHRQLRMAQEEASNPKPSVVKKVMDKVGNIAGNVKNRIGGYAPLTANTPGEEYEIPQTLPYHDKAPV